MNILRWILGTKNDREVKRLFKVVEQINALEPAMEKLSDAELAAQTTKFREQLKNGKTLDELLPEAFATCREASKRVLKMRHFDVQLIGGMVLHQGKISEMKTGEGKTLTATLAIYLNALSGRGVHLVTVNDYLVKRDAEEMGKLYSFLGMTTGVIVHGLTDTQRREAYACDITYGTNNEFGFDYLRDNMKVDPTRMVQREHVFAIVDEVDSILIDEARTPLIISGPADTNIELYGTVNKTIPGLQKDSDYIVDEKSHTVTMTEDGIAKVERRLGIENLYDPTNIDALQRVEQALKAHFLFKKDVDYVVRDGQIIIVDEFTGRLMPGRRYSDGLHGALEAKEHVRVQQETQTLATITFQNLFRKYEKVSGMTGTADTEAVEFEKIYKLQVVVIPTNRQMIRNDNPDIIYKSAREKFNAIADEIAAAQRKGQPVLVGTVSVEKSELLSTLLNKRGIPHEILNAKNHAREAEIIKSAGQKGRVTLSTNMAGRGTDIVLGPGVRELGGLYVVGTERHESRRIDNQLRGRSGRQGDPGKTVFYLSLEDDLMRIFASERLAAIFEKLGMKEGESIESKMVTGTIERAQRRVEEQNFSSRKHLLEYDDVMNQQRQVIYKRRNNLLKLGEGVNFLPDVSYNIVYSTIEKHSPEKSASSNWEVPKAEEALKAEFNFPIKLKADDLESLSIDVLVQSAHDQLMQQYTAKTQMVGADNMKMVENHVYLQIIDTMWKEHLLSMDHLRDSVRLRAHGQRDPLQEYKKEGFRYFATLMERIEDETVLALLRMPPPQEIKPEDLVQEENFEDMQFKHDDAGSALNKRKGPSDDQMVYNNGNRGEPEKPQTFIREQPKVGRNDPCHCGSGKKYKKCHGKSEPQLQV